MDFIIGFPRTSKHYAVIMIVIDNLIMIANFVEVKSTNFSSEVSQIFIKEIVRLHGIAKKIFQIEMLSSLHGFGRNCLKFWVQNCYSS